MFYTIYQFSNFVFINNPHLKKIVMNTQKIHTNRVPSLDFARILAMLMMIAGHTFFSLINPYAININEFPWSWWEFLRGATAPIFLTVSGIAQVFANKRDQHGKLNPQTSQKRLKNALMLIAIGYLLMFPANKIYDIPFIPTQQLAGFFAVNILQLIGVTLLLVLLLFQLTRNDKQLFIASLTIGIALILFTPVSQFINWFNILPYALANYFDYTHGSYFGIFPFSAYVFIGVALGTLLKKVPSEQRIDYIIKYSFYSIPIFVILGFLSHKIEYPYIKDLFAPYRASIGMIFYRYALVAMMFVITGLLSKKLYDYYEYFTFFGQKALYVYIVHIFILYGSAVTPGLTYFFAETTSIALALANIPIVIIGTILLTYILHKLIETSKQFTVAYKFSITAYLIYLLFI